ncbi:MULTISPECIES: response regulator transcription factor [unclassified Nesterenkonia]|uniref:response regulator transcription factor n=1 Tax=unclassified Nesterenkonia TaxID=2629769 RepID=UPI000871E7F2|nr:MULTISPECIES: response regulator transcription factor [unclassified Nesterenkonia]MDS2171786.1 response regulator transcription factor [Nesterenkonia sp. CL21]OSM43936.1 DNA-binding response regulator [Nesterenkonia sp. PF2B19]
MTIHVVLADDQDLVRAGIRALLARGAQEGGASGTLGDEPLEVVGEAVDGDDALRVVRRTRPDVVLMDLRMPGTDGVAATRAIRADPQLDGVRVLILTTFDDDADVLDAVRAGAAGYLLKDTPAEQLRGAVRTAAEGGNLLSPQIARRLMEHVAALPSPASGPDDGAGLDLSELTDREHEVLRAVAQGLTNAEIGATLHLSPATARTYVSRILHKLHARDRTELAILAHRAGLGPPEPRG